MNRIVAVSGGFDPLHVGHLRMMKKAAEMGDLVVILNSDEWLMRKKGYVFMKLSHRAELLAALSCVHMVRVAHDDDGTVCATLRALEPDIFVNAGDRKPDNTPEKVVCEELGIAMAYVDVDDAHLGSSDIIKNACSVLMLNGDL